MKVKNFCSLPLIVLPEKPCLNKAFVKIPAFVFFATHEQPTEFVLLIYLFEELLFDKWFEQSRLSIVKSPVVCEGLEECFRQMFEVCPH